MSVHVVVGAGAVGTGTALALAAQGHNVKVITRSGNGPSHENIELIVADASDRNTLIKLVTGAHSLYNCANPPYNKWPATWPPLNASLIAAAEATSARLITMSNLYGYAQNSSPMRSTDPFAPSSRKGAVRADMWATALQAHNDGRIRATELRASDYFGPGLGDTAYLGDRVVPRALAGKKVSILGDPHAPHSWSYIGDVCTTLATLGTNDQSLGRPWHTPTAPPRSATHMIAELCKANGTDAVKISRIPRLAVKAIGLVVPMLREMDEMLYQFESEFVIDATDTETTFGLTATPLAEQIAATIASYR